MQFNHTYNNSSNNDDDDDDDIILTFNIDIHSSGDLDLESAHTQPHAHSLTRTHLRFR